MKVRDVLLVSYLLAVCGCGSSAVNVRGTVKLDGEPIPDGQIAFVIENTAISGGGTITNGAYSVEVPPGNAKVQITASKKMPLPPGEKSMYGESEEVRQYIPSKYNTKTELKVEVTAAKPLDFDLKSK